jgi:aryl-alcohol dehydrogenase-like predicted oxidoreductase
MPDTVMSYQPLGASGLKAPRLWLGTMMFGDQTGADEAARIVESARAAGVNAIDTADSYTGGEAERMVGRLIAADRERWVLATKAANPTSDAPNDRGLSRRHLTLAVEASLKRLGTDWIDVLYLHRDDETTPVEETAATLATLIERGRIHYFGVSNFRAWRVARLVETCRAMGVPQPIVCQPPYSAMTRMIEAELLPCCAHYGLAAVVYSPLARGVLSGKYLPDAPLPEGTRAARADRRLMQTEFRRESLQLAQRMTEHAQRRGLTTAQLALAWVWNNRLVHGLVAGPRTLEQWRQYLDALDVPFTADDEAFVSGLVPAGHASTYGYTDPIYPVTGRAPRKTP